jgi:hypothetical protein
MALLKLSTIIVDFLMLNVFPKRDIYQREKYTTTEDFSELAKNKALEE